VVGVNSFVEGDDAPTGLFTVDEGIRRQQTAKLKKLRSTRDSALVKQRLDGLREAASGMANTIPAILECVSAYATLGEISDSLREVWGEHS